MAQWHIDELRTALQKRGWYVSSELPGDDYAISGSWELRRWGDAATIVLEFEGLDDMRTLPLVESYGCRVRGTNQSLYFRRRGKSGSAARNRWTLELSSFVKLFDEIKEINSQPD